MLLNFFIYKVVMIRVRRDRNFFPFLRLDFCTQGEQDFTTSLISPPGCIFKVKQLISIFTTFMNFSTNPVGSLTWLVWFWESVGYFQSLWSNKDLIYPHILNHKKYTNNCFQVLDNRHCRTVMPEREINRWALQLPNLTAWSKFLGWV